MSEWRSIPGWEECYEISDAGQIRSVRSGPGTHVGRILRQWINNKGYPKVMLCRNGGGQQQYVHRLVAFAFLGPCPDGQIVHHRDHNPLNSHVSNLEYASPSANAIYGYRHGNRRSQQGDTSPHAKLTPEQVQEIRASSGTQRSLASRYGVNPSTIGRIRRGESWTNVVQMRANGGS